MSSRNKPRLDLSCVPRSLAPDAAPSVLQSMVEWWTDLTWYFFDCNMDHVNAAWTKVYAELEEVGLAHDPVDDDDGGYLHQIRLEVAWLPSMRGELGFVYEGLDWQAKFSGYEEGVIYLPSNRANRAYVPGGGLVDVVRHEYAHTWHWIEPEFFETGWFDQAFGGHYDLNSNRPYVDWWDRLVDDEQFEEKYDRTRTPQGKMRLLERACLDEFVSWYAATQPCEDFAETFRTYLRFRKNLDKFRSRPGVYRKLKAVEQAVGKARKELGLG